MDVWSKNTKFDTVRRFGLRPDTVERWERFSIRDFINQGSHIDQMVSNIQVMRLVNFLTFFPDSIRYDRGLSVEGQFMVGDLLDIHSTHPIVEGLFAIVDDLEQYQNRSRARTITFYQTHLETAGEKMLGFRTNVQRHRYAWYHRNLIQEGNLINVHAENERLFGERVRNLE